MRLAQSFLWFITMIALTSPPLVAAEGVILLHGLARSSASMERMARFLNEHGYVTLNVDYPSTSDSIEALADEAIAAALDDEAIRDCVKVHLVTHSMGGILVRSYFSKRTNPRLGRVVMLGPPNQGSEVVDKIGAWRAFHWLNGPAGRELGTDAASTPNSLGPVNFELGVIAGKRSINWINSAMIEGPNDGKVSVERTKVAGMTDHIVLPATHPMIMRNRSAMRCTFRFLQSGSFDDPAENAVPAPPFQ